MSSRDPLFLIFDTNVFLEAPHYRQDGLINDHRSAVELLKDFHEGKRGTLPLLSVRIPWIVRLELGSLSERNPCSWYSPDSRDARACAAVDYIDEAVYQGRSELIAFQTVKEHQEAKNLQKTAADNDELVLFCCFQTMEYYSPNVWLITNDVRLTARAVRSRLNALSFSGLKHALTLRNDVGAAKGDTFMDTVPKEWMTTRAKLGEVWLKNEAENRRDNVGAPDRIVGTKQAAVETEEKQVSTKAEVPDGWINNFRFWMAASGQELRNRLKTEHKYILLFLVMELVSYVCVQREKLTNILA